MWGKKDKTAKVSPMMEGLNIFKTMGNSMYGRIKNVFNGLFSTEEIKMYKLPTVIVIGNESTGKSSILENITKCQLFPRDSKICTKCPIHVKLTNGPPKYTIKIGNICTTLKNKNEIYGMVNEHMKKMPNDFISEEKITIEIMDENMPTFEFLDLPGIRAYPQEMADKTMKLCEKYLSDKNSIVLCVVPATATRLTSCQSIALITKMKMETKSILALTMADRLQPINIEELLISRIINTSDELSELNFAGCVSVVNRTHEDIHSLSENDTNENKWFNDNIISCIPEEYKKYQKTIEDNTTIGNLIKQMDVLYNRFIHSDWKPKILKEIDEKLIKMEKEYLELGPLEFDHKLVNKIINYFVDIIFDEIIDKKTVVLDENDEEDEGENEGENEGDDEVVNIKKYKKYELYTEYNDLIDNMSKNIKTNTIELIGSKIDHFFEENKEYKLVRFEKIKEILKINIACKYVGLYEKGIENIKKICKDRFLMNYVDETKKYESRDFYRYHQLLILYPALIKNKYGDFNENEYVESIEYAEKRRNLSEIITKTKKHHNDIKLLSI